MKKYIGVMLVALGALLLILSAFVPFMNDLHLLYLPRLFVLGGDYSAGFSFSSVMTSL